jgi:hypothetical protein
LSSEYNEKVENSNRDNGVDIVLQNDDKDDNNEDNHQSESVINSIKWRQLLSGDEKKIPFFETPSNCVMSFTSANVI